MLLGNRLIVLYHPRHPCEKKTRRKPAHQLLLSTGPSVRQEPEEEDPQPSPIPCAQVESSNCSATRVISMDDPPSGSFNRKNANDKRSIPTSASQQAARNSRRFATRRENRKGHDASQMDVLQIPLSKQNVVGLFYLNPFIYGPSSDVAWKLNSSKMN
jgi:hypothetical protein